VTCYRIWFTTRLSHQLRSKYFIDTKQTLHNDLTYSFMPAAHLMTQFSSIDKNVDFYEFVKNE